MNRLTIIGLVIVIVLVIVALFAPWIAHYDVGATNLSMRYLPPSAEHWFGTDSTGRDIFSRVVFGARISLQVGIIVVVVSTVIGTLLGAIAGYYGGWVDRFVSDYVFNVFLAFPGLLLAIALEFGEGELVERQQETLFSRQFDFDCASVRIARPTFGCFCAHGFQ